MMIESINYILLIIYGFFIPFALGRLWTRKSEYVNSFAMSLTSGVIMMLGIFEVLAVPMILRKQSFHVLVNSWKVIVWILALIAICISIKDFPNMFKGRIRNICMKSKTELLIWIAALFVIVFQTYMPVGHMRTDTDDARFVAEAMEAYELDTMLQYHPITGDFLEMPIGEMKKDIISPFPIFMALMSSLLRLPPAVAVHVFFPLMLIPLAYVVYYLIGRYFINNNSKYVALFLFFLGLIHCFAYESIYAAGYTLLAVIWQGRSVLAMIIMPFIWLLLMRILDRRAEVRVWDYLFLLCAIFAGIMTSSMAIELLPILVGTYSFMIGVKNRDIKLGMLTFMCLIPCVIGYIIYR